MTRIYAISQRGKNKGAVLTPHRYEGGFFVVTKGRHSSDPRHEVRHANELVDWIARGYGIRMSSASPLHAPSTFMPQSLIVHHS